MNRQKRYAGRAICKRRREQREMFAIISAIDFDAFQTGMAEAIIEFGRVLEAATASIAWFFAEFNAAHAEAREQEFRMTHRALTTGHEVTR